MKNNNCENCVYYNNDSIDQPCCSCVCNINFEQGDEDDV